MREGRTGEWQLRLSLSVGQMRGGKSLEEWLKIPNRHDKKFGNTYEYRKMTVINVSRAKSISRIGRQYIIAQLEQRREDQCGTLE